MKPSLRPDSAPYPGTIYTGPGCRLLLVPEDVPLQGNGRFGSEGFIAWWQRRWGADGAPCQVEELSCEGRRFYLLLDDDRESSKQSGSLRRAEGGWELHHPMLATPVAVSLPADPLQSTSCDWLDSKSTNAFRCDPLIQSTVPEGSCTCLDKSLLFQSTTQPNESQRRKLQTSLASAGFSRAFWKRHDRAVQSKDKESVCPELLWGDSETEQVVLEDEVAYEVRFDEGYSFGLFLDQRENRFRLRSNRIHPGFEVLPTSSGERPRVLNTFAYTCSFSVCAALAGAKVFSVDLSRKYLEWGKRNFDKNGLDVADHEFLYGDVFGWLKRFRRRQELFDLVVIDPPTFSRSKEWGVFKVSRDLGKLVSMSVDLLPPRGRLLVSCNAAQWSPAEFVATVREAVQTAGRRVGRECYATQPWDFGVVRAEESYLKTIWVEVL